MVERSKVNTIPSPQPNSCPKPLILNPQLSTNIGILLRRCSHTNTVYRLMYFLRCFSCPCKVLNKQVGDGRYYKKKCLIKKVGNNGSSFSPPEMAKHYIPVLGFLIFTATTPMRGSDQSS